MAGALLTRSPAKLAHKAFQRILVKRGFTREMADLLLTDIKDAIASLSTSTLKRRSHPLLHSQAPTTIFEATEFAGT